MIEFKCPHCSKPIQVSDELAGKQGKCPHCKTPVLAPAPMIFEVEGDDLPPSVRLTSSSIIRQAQPSPPKPTSIPKPSLMQTTKSLVGNLLYWVFGIFYSVGFLAAVFRFPFASLALLVAAFLLLPPVFNRITTTLNFDVRPSVRVVSAAVLLVLFSVLLSQEASIEADKSRAENHAVLAQVRADERSSKIQDLATNKPTIVNNFQALLAAGKVSEARTSLLKYQDLGDADITALLASVNARAQEIARIQRKAELTAKLAGLKSEDLSGLEETYSQLHELEPSNKDYAQKQASYHLAVAKARELSERQTRGLAWRYVNSSDSMSQKSVSIALVQSINMLSFSFPYAGAQRATLQLRKHPRWGQDVILNIEKGQFLCNSYDGCSVSVRFGNGKPRRFSASEPSDISSSTVFIRGYDSFVSELRKVDKVYIEASFYQEGNRAMEFAVDGLDWK